MSVSETQLAVDENSNAGWKSDPEIPGRERYWDGSVWTKKLRASDPEVELMEEDDRLVKWGIAMAFLTPLIGFVLGAVSCARGRRVPAGVAVMFAAMVMAWVWLAIYVQVVVDEPTF